MLCEGDRCAQRGHMTGFWEEPACRESVSLGNKGTSRTEKVKML